MSSRSMLQTSALVVLLLCATLLPDGTSWVGSTSEYDIKAALLYKMAKFIEWPTDKLSQSNNDFILCILGENPFGKALDSIRDKPIHDRKLKALSIHSLPTAGSCQILFISALEQDRLSSILQAVEGAAILTVSDMPNFVQHGGMIGLVMDKGSIRFEINAAAIKRSKLNVSSKLLQLAVSVRNE